MNANKPVKRPAKKVICPLALLICTLLWSAGSAVAQRIEPVGRMIGVDKETRRIHQIDANGISIGYKLIGAGPPLLMIMGLGGTMDQWPEEIIEGLSKRHQLILMDNRGMGYTTVNSTRFDYDTFAGDVIGLMNALGVKKTSVLGYSMGSTIAQECLINYPQRFNKAIFCAPSLAGNDLVCGLDLTALHDRIILRQIDATRLWITPMDKLATITNRVMLVVGTSDNVVGDDAAKKMASTIPGASLVELKHGTHALMDQVPLEFTRIVANFLDTTETKRVK